VKLSRHVRTGTASLTPASPPAQRLHQLASGTTTEAALAFFDSLPPVELATMMGSWRGKGLQTGHPMDGLLERFGWHGKRFTGPDGAHPLVFVRTKGGVFSVNPAMIPVGFVLRHADLFRHPLAGRLFRDDDLRCPADQRHLSQGR
jgi:GXWXG protein